jgi:hypothetical protein
VNELRERVEDWKGHRLDSFGELLLHGTHHVIKGGSNSGKEEEREVGTSLLLHFDEPPPANLTDTVQNIPVSDDTALLQGNERRQAKEPEESADG